MLTIKDLTVTYDQTPVLEGMTAHFEPACIHGLVGLNGCGKTTLFHAIYGWIKPRKGEILWNNVPLSRKNMALLETKNFFYSSITGREYLSLFAAETGKMNLLVWQRLFHLPLDDDIATYSTGMKKKLALTAILKLDKPVVLLDEPFNGVDLEAVNIIKLLLKQLKGRGKTVLVTSHVLETLGATCDYIHYLENKRIARTFSRNETAIMEDILFRQREGELNTLIAKGLS